MSATCTPSEGGATTRSVAVAPAPGEPTTTTECVPAPGAYYSELAYCTTPVSESWKATSDYELATFRSRPDFVLTGRRHTTGGASDEFSVAESEYADDTGAVFCSRADAQVQTPRLMSHYRRWGLEVHAGSVVPPPLPPPPLPAPPPP
eukprot:scaffold26907_cov72-Phaeocystis_antarctica.AAC.5